MNRSIFLSPKHGVNPSVVVCFACSESYGVALFGRMKPKPTGRLGVYGDPITEADPEAPRQIRGRDLCDRCRKAVADGAVLLIEAVPAPPGRARQAEAGRVGEPERTGRMWGLKREAFDRIFHGVTPEDGICFIDREAADQIFGAPGQEVTP